MKARRGGATQFIVLLLGAIALAGAQPEAALAQGGGWSEPVLIFEGDGEIRTPAIVADEYGQVHAFWVFSGNDSAETPPGLIYYTRLDQPDWQPVDISSVRGSFTSLAAATGGGGLGLLWNGSSYAWAGPSPEASARAWVGPITLQPAYFVSGLTAAPDGALWVIDGSKEANAVFVQRLDPESLTWGEPQLVANSSNLNAAPDALRLAVGQDGSLHAVWTEYQLPQGWPTLGLYYARSVDGGQTWSLPWSVARGGYNQPNVAAGPDGHVYLAWTGVAGIGGKYFQESLDDGRTWSNVTDILPPGSGGGSEGAPNLALDSAGVLHMLFSNNGCVWYLSLESAGWTTPECISGRPAHIEEPAMTLGLGNQLHVLYWKDNRELWYTTRVLPVPGQQPLRIPTLPPPTATVAVPTLTPVPSQTPLPDFGAPPRAGQTVEAGLWAMAAGVAPVALLVLMVLARRLQRRRFRS